jgi:hypothetical protein
MRTFIVAVLIVFTLFAGMVSGGGYKITKVIDVGPADIGPMVWPFKWSPDGIHLAYFSGGALNVCDTLGKNYGVFSFDLSVHRYEWLSDYEILIHGFRDTAVSGRPAYYNRLAELDILNGNQTILEEYFRLPGSDADNNPKSFNGPWRAIEGPLYYRTNISKSITGRQKATLIVPGNTSPSKHQVKDMHYPAWGDDGLYLVSLDRFDSVRIGPKPTSHIPLPPEISQDKKYYIHGGTICRLIDSSYIVLDTIIKDLPPKTTGCNIIYSQFNPVRAEVLFTIIYSDMDEYEVMAVGTYDLGTGELTIIDPQCGLTECNAPSYGPTGSKIALASRGHLFIIYREKEQ